MSHWNHEEVVKIHSPTADSINKLFPAVITESIVSADQHSSS